MMKKNAREQTGMPGPCLGAASGLRFGRLASWGALPGVGKPYTYIY